MGVTPRLTPRMSYIWRENWTKSAASIDLAKSPAANSEAMYLGDVSGTQQIKLWKTRKLVPGEDGDAGSGDDPVPTGGPLGAD
ncbi:uncharacterized protein Z518_04378 [Rhinocladiella mackenziei CBS 650.93]|uniref:Uncharacterized protein n=1 Tax=Rhinocladiella mackenziei CBS 650.93 TaxID=1442369 RepID=A0A0D2FW63_9EURO|nr:uncharacterized protein Z518_04378 [Rhinocladiella mackenziei CBS 650.93]KIX06402.1 hypothetical protein Z518_04378 [Rhinocladiella mackenziei CBS 650.93]